VDFLAAGPELWQRYHEFRRARQKEERPDDPVRPDDAEERRLKRANPQDFEYRYEISSGGVIVSMLGASTVRPANPEYATNKHLMWMDAYVRPSHRRRRIGASWLAVILELMDRHGCTTLGIGTVDEAGHAFLRWLGAEAKLIGAENRLRVADVDWAMVERWVREGQQRSPHTKLEIHDGRVPEAMWTALASSLTAMFSAAPMDDLDHGDSISTPESIRYYYERMEAAGETTLSALTREPDGIVTGFTEVTWAPYRPAIIQQQFTGVVPSATGRGLGKWVKAAMLLHLRELYPDFQWMSTGNAGSNAPMLAINQRLGFRHYRTETEYQVTRDQIAARLGGQQPA
jgi:GNAT superfamily N-acetyltransferase